MLWTHQNTVIAHFTLSVRLAIMAENDKPETA
jgi:hypothetical protein